MMKEMTVYGTHAEDVAGYPDSSPKGFVHKLSGNGTKVGSSMLLKVMAGDKVHIRVDSWYRLNNANPANIHSATTAISSILQSMVAGSSGGKFTPGAPGASGLMESLVSAFATNRQAEAPAAGKPKAYLNWILFDNQMNAVITNDGKNSGADIVGEDDLQKHHIIDSRELTKSGYLYIYVSNESQDVNLFFDNLTVTHLKGPLVEETHYYPFGLAMAGISSRAANTLENKRKWNKGSELESKEFSDGSGLELYSTFYRSLDPQLGRFWQIDPKPNYEQSLYSSMGNNPISFNDPLGDTLRGSSNQDGRRLQRMIRQTFRGMEMKDVRQMFQRRLFAGDRKTFGTIREGQVNQATANLSADQKSLVKGYVDAINSTQVHTVEVARRGESLKDANSVISIGGTMTRTGGDVDAAAGGGFNIPTATGTHSVIVMNSTANIPDYRDNNTGNLVPGMTSNRGELLAHELLGHGLTRFNAGGSQFLNAIQLTNLYHRATGTGNLYRDGTSHGGTTGIPLTYPQASAVPLYLQ